MEYLLIFSYFPHQTIEVAGIILFSGYSFQSIALIPCVIFDISVYRIISSKKLIFPKELFLLLSRNLEKLYRLLENGNLGLRLATGEVIALIYELGRELDETFDMYVDGLYDLLKELATDSSRYKAKREKRQQRSTFRDVLKTVEVCFQAFTYNTQRFANDLHWFAD